MLVAVATRNMQEMQHGGALPCAWLACVSLVHLHGAFGDQVFPGCAWSAGFEKGSLHGGKPFLTHLLTQNPRGFSLGCGTALFWRESYGSRWGKLDTKNTLFWGAFYREMIALSVLNKAIKNHCIKHSWASQPMPDGEGKLRKVSCYKR